MRSQQLGSTCNKVNIHKWKMTQSQPETQRVNLRRNIEQDEVYLKCLKIHNQALKLFNINDYNIRSLFMLALSSRLGAAAFHSFHPPLFLPSWHVSVPQVFPHHLGDTPDLHLLFTLVYPKSKGAKVTAILSLVGASDSSSRACLVDFPSCTKPAGWRRWRRAPHVRI